VTSEIRLFIRVTVAKDKLVVATPEEPASSFEVGGFSELAMLSAHALHIDLGKSYHITVDLLSEMPGILEEIGFNRFPHCTIFHVV
jgi:hypothetical protein